MTADVPLATLIVEDSEDDALLLVRHLTRADYDLEYERADTRERLLAALRRRRWDVILCDYTLPRLSVFDALDLIRQTDPDVPLIVVTGSMGEDELVRLIKLGAKDIVLKTNLARLKPAIDREIAEAERRRRGRRAEIMLVDAIENTSEGVALFDAAGRIVLRNTRYADFFGPGAKMVVPGAAYADILREAILSGHFEVTDPQPDGFIRERLDAGNCDTGKPLEQALSDGRWIRLHERRTKDDGMIAVVTDITERKRREDRLRKQAVQLQQINESLSREIALRRTTEGFLRESESRLSAILAGAGDGIITFASTGAVESANPAAANILGQTAADLVGQQVATLFRPSGSDRASEATPEWTALPFEIGRVREMVARRPDKSAVPIEMLVSEAEFDDRSVLVVMIRDISERAELDRMKGEFVSVVSHELRTPLTAIKGSLRLLQSDALGELPPPARPIVDMATRNSERLIRLIDDILDIEKIEVGKMEFSFQPVKLRMLVETAVRDNRPFAEQIGVRIELAEGGEDTMVLADGHRLVQVLTNLLSNAAKYSHQGGVVRVEIEPGPDVVRTRVVDNGEGIPEALQNRIFEKFVQVDSSDTRRRGGTGLGLSIAQAIVERHGGRIAVNSAPGKGSTFYFDLPGWREGSVLIDDLRPAIVG